jgi:hypothetical protein
MPSRASATSPRIVLVDLTHEQPSLASCDDCSGPGRDSACPSRDTCHRPLTQTAPMDELVVQLLSGCMGLVLPYRTIYHRLSDVPGRCPLSRRGQSSNPLRPVTRQISLAAVQAWTKSQPAHLLVPEDCAARIAIVRRSPCSPLSGHRR